MDSKLLLCLAFIMVLPSDLNKFLPEKPTYEVVSVRPTAPDSKVTPQIQVVGDGIEERNNTLFLVIRYAFHIVDAERLKGGPAWIDKEKFDIEAKVAPAMSDSFHALTEQQKAELLQPVLEDRFRLKYHTEKREFPVYFLEVAKSGSKLTEAKADDDGKYKSSMHTNRKPEFIGKALTIEQMDVDLSYYAGQQVIDKTGLPGHYDFDLTWAAARAADGNSGVGEIPDGPSFFDAVELQMGLKLVPGKALFDVYVIDNVERPTPN